CARDESSISIAFDYW
nr:immunoglobulin heavy chain junction region [Macaca mulatta]MOW88806.1 immunoglobulin heavy chain junction region [Macaca mulatta]MOW90014.1 immunoglobulin heavy chain junction region [Macaca mulatta]